MRRYYRILTDVMEDGRALAPPTATASARGPAPGGEPQSAGRHLVDSSQRGSLAELPNEFPPPSSCWRLRDWEEPRLAGHRANVSGGVE